MTQQACHYCGAEPSAVLAIKKHHGSFRYNGIDRVDSEGDYTESNTVPACKDCNRAKRTMSSDEFKNWIVRVFNHIKKGG